MRQAQEMSQHLRLVQLRESRQIIAAEVGAENFRPALRARRETRQINSAPIECGELEDEGNLALRFRLGFWIVGFAHWNNSDPGCRRHYRFSAASASTSARRVKSLARLISVTAICNPSSSSG